MQPLMSSEPTPQAIARTYQFYAPIYDKVFGAILGPGRHALARAVQRLGPQSLLEVGVGTGLMLAEYPEATRITGVDLSPHMLEHARHRAAELARGNIELQVMDAEKMPFADGSFDCVTVPYVLSVTTDPEQLVAEVRRVCRKGGTIMVLNHFSGSRFWWLLERAVRQVADRIGFRSDFGYDEHILRHDWQVLSVTPVNLFGLSRLVVLENR
jgi:phosphatidylethanolamine/phosphatidyl-N-methylethanolamine N-methyltransferase